MLEQVIQSRIQRKIDGLEIIPVRFENEVKKSIYVIKIPESSLAPHMTSDKRFYKRYNFESVQMEEYEIRNLYNRKADIYFGRDKKILKERSKLKEKTLQERRKNYIIRKLELDYENI